MGNSRHSFRHDLDIHSQTLHWRSDMAHQAERALSCEQVKNPPNRLSEFFFPNSNWHTSYFEVVNIVRILYCNIVHSCIKFAVL
jgi:hypothetical protein